MLQYHWVSSVLILLNLIVSYKGLTNPAFFEGYLFEVDPINKDKDYKRLITSGFLHVSWAHLLFNMLSLYFFSRTLEVVLGGLNFLLIYMASLIGGGILGLIVHRNHGAYRAVGASGAVCGIIFAAIALFPSMDVGILFLPIGIPAWLYGIIYVGFTIYAIRSGRDNVGHAAHLGGALVGLLVAILIMPQALVYNYLSILLIALPTLVFVWLLVKRPHLLLVPISSGRRDDRYFHNVETRYNAEKRTVQNEVDRILDKIASRGIDSLSKKEQEVLRRHSETLK